jgi:hypothetical protein
LGGVAVMSYTLIDAINQYTLLAVPVVLLVLGSVLSRWVIR